MLSGPVRELSQGEFLLKTIWFSLDLYMRPRMSDIKNYLQPIFSLSVFNVMKARSETT